MLRVFIYFYSPHLATSPASQLLFGMHHPRVDKSMCIAPRSHPRRVRGDLFLTPLPPHKPKKGFSTESIRTSAPATGFTKRHHAIVFPSRTILPTPAHGEGWKPSAQNFQAVPQKTPFGLARAARVCGAAFAVLTAGVPTLLPAKGMGKASGDGAQKCADGNVAGEGVGRL